MNSYHMALQFKITFIGAIKTQDLRHLSTFGNKKIGHIKNQEDLPKAHNISD